MNKIGAIERARELVAAKVPFLHQGRDFSGIDCIGALRYIFQYEGELPAYPADPIHGELEANLDRIVGQPVIVVPRLQPLTTQDQLSSLDIVTMQYAGPTRHVAFVLPHINIPGVLSIVHTDAMLGCVTEHILDVKWLRRIVKVYRV